MESIEKRVSVPSLKIIGDGPPGPDTCKLSPYFFTYRFNFKLLSSPILKENNFTIYRVACEQKEHVCESVFPTFCPLSHTTPICRFRLWSAILLRTRSIIVKHKFSLICKLTCHLRITQGPEHP